MTIVISAGERLAAMGTRTSDRNGDGGYVVDLGDLDGVAVAPGNHRLLFENDDVRVLETTIAVGETTPLHTHLAPTVMYVVSGSHFRRRDETGAVLVDTRATPGFVLPKVLFSPGLPRHTLENTGDDPLVVIGVELKHPRSSSGPQ